ncbi:MAG: hypothetical protein GX890_02925 [Firmicutes bacterium]|nr:hypothetical protein [Bacillota bacterium]
MVIIIEDFIPRGRRNRPGYKLVPRYITIHDTANTNVGADAMTHARYLKSNAAAAIPASWHFTVDDRVIVQHLPLNENGWHAGDGSTGTGNRESIGIEICENRDGVRTEAEKNAAWLTAKLLKDFSLGLDRVKQHYYWSGKDCPRVLRGRAKGWESFLNAVSQYLQPPGNTPITGKAQATVHQAQEWARRRQAHARFIEIAPVYWLYGALTGIRPEVLYAQSAKETAFGRFGGAVHPDQNNWAGIKVQYPKGDSRADFESFPTPEEGVRAHFNHMCAYVGLQPVGVPHGRYWVVLAQPWAGQVRYVEELGGKWAVGADYGISIVRDYLEDLLATPSPPVVEPPSPPPETTPEPPTQPEPEPPEEPAPEPPPPEIPGPEPAPKPSPEPAGSFLVELILRLIDFFRELLKKLAQKLK